MGEASAPLSGSGSQSVLGKVWRTGQNQGGNYTSFHGEVWYIGNGYGSWTGSAGYWSGSAPGLYVSGSWTIPYANRNDYSTLLWAGDWNIGHDGNGYLGAFNLVASIDYSAHSSIGSGTAYAYEPDAPRIPKPPSAPGTPGFSGLGPKSVTLSWGTPGDNRGSAIDGYQVLISTNPNPEVSPIVNAQPGNVNSYGVNTLSPATKYYAKVRAHNGSAGGWGDWSGVSSFTTLSGMYLGLSGGTFQGVEILVGVAGGTFATVPEVRIGASDGSSFVLAG